MTETTAPTAPEPTTGDPRADAAIAEGAAVAAKTARKPRAPKAATPAKAAPKAAPKAEPKVRKAATPKERAAKPVTVNIAAYVEWLNAEVFDGKLTEPMKRAAGISITLYGAYQSSPERKAARR